MYTAENKSKNNIKKFGENNGRELERSTYGFY